MLRDVISPVLVSEVSLPEGHPRHPQDCVVFGFVVHHAEGPVLVDTGVGVGHSGIDRAYAPVHHGLDQALSAMGVHKDDVMMVINTHLHFDHSGNNRLFPGVPLVVQRKEYDDAQRPRYTIPEWIEFQGANWVFVEGDVEVLNGVSVLATPGHTRGHQSVVVSTSSGVDVIAGQAVYDRDELESEASIEPLTVFEMEQTSGSARKIKAADPQQVFFSHDPRPWVPNTTSAPTVHHT